MSATPKKGRAPQQKRGGTPIIFNEEEDLRKDIEKLSEGLKDAEKREAEELSRKLVEIDVDYEERRRRLGSAADLLDDLTEDFPLDKYPDDESRERARKQRENFRKQIEKRAEQLEIERDAATSKARGTVKKAKVRELGVALRNLLSAGFSALIAFLTSEGIAGLNAFANPKSTKLRSAFTAALAKDCLKIRGLLNNPNLEDNLIGEFAAAGAATAIELAKQLMDALRKIDRACRSARGK